MSFDSVRAAFVTRLNAWPDAPIAWDGHRVPPAVKAAQAAKDPWCRVTIRDGDRGYATHEGIARHAGVLFVQIFTQDGIGPKTARDLADSLATHLDGYTSGALVCRAASMAVIGPADGWYQLNLTLPWREYA